MVRIEKIIENKKQFLDLLLLADEQENMIDKYLPDGDLFALYDDDLKSICVVVPIDSEICELKNIATYEKFQGKGYGRALINFIFDFYKNDFKTMLVGTGETPAILSFYESCGFEKSHRVKNFFTDNYGHPMFEGNIQLVDMIYLKKEFVNNSLYLKPLQDEDVEQLKIWLYKDHILNWFHDTDDWLKEVKERNGEFSFLHHFIVNNKNKPIGFCQYYDCFDAKEPWYSVESRGKLFSIDYLIGEENYLRKGFGKQIIKLLIDEISKENKNFEIIVQPEMENTASNRTLLANGFNYDENKQYYTLKVEHK
jgi:GNAT superfamily N-acetyltransferase